MTIQQIKEQLADVRYEEWEGLKEVLAQDERAGVHRLLKQKERQFQRDKARRDDYIRRQSFERALWATGLTRVAGVDEVGRGPLAGPVIAAAVVLPLDFYHDGLNDSKKMSKHAREAAYEAILACADVGVGIVDADVIDDVNIYEATKRAMAEAVSQLESVDALLVDAMRLEVDLPQTALIKGDARSVSIAAASVVAKVIRDRMMAAYAVTYPGYAFEQNAGYGTKAHLEGLARHGVTPIHRKTFAPVKYM